MVELLKQPQYVPMPVSDQVISIYAGAKGYLDQVALKDVAAFEEALMEYFSTSGRAIRGELEQKKALDDELEKKLGDASRTSPPTGSGTGRPASRRRVRAGTGGRPRAGDGCRGELRAAGQRLTLA